MSYEVLESREKYHGHIVNVREDVIRLPDGKEVTREIVERGNASAVLPIDENGKLLFVRQYRHAFQEMLLEIPAGMIEEGEDPRNCIHRELEEETGYYSDDITFMFEMYPTVGFCIEIVYIYLARNLKQGNMNLDEDEFIEVERYNLDEALDMIYDGRIKDSKTIVAVMSYQNMLLKENK